MCILLIVLPLVSLIYSVSGEPVVDVDGNVVVTGEKYHLRPVNEYGNVYGGIKFERRDGWFGFDPWDYLRLTESAENLGVSVFLWRSENAYIPRIPVNTDLRLKIQMSESNFKHHTLLKGNTDEIWLDRDDKKDKWTPFTLTPVHYPYQKRPAYTLAYNAIPGVAVSCLTLRKDDKWLGLSYLDRCGLDGIMFEIHPVRNDGV